MQELFTHLINQAYRVYQGKLIPEISKPANISYYLEFGGFQLSYNWYGRSRLSKELVGNLIIHKKVIHLNSRFLYQLAKLDSLDGNYHSEYNLKRLIHTIAHEVAHCLLGDYSLDLFQSHGDFHDGLTTLLENYLWTAPEVQELEKLQKNTKKVRKLR